MTSRRFLACSTLLFACTNAVPSSAPVAAETPSSVSLALTFCGSTVDACHDMHSTTVDFDKKTVATHRCVELPKGTHSHGSSFGPDRDDVFETHTATDDQLERIRRALTQVRYEHATETDYDGAMTILKVTRDREDHVYSPNARCGGDYDQIVAGMDALQGEMDALAAAATATQTPPSGFGP